MGDAFEKIFSRFGLFLRYLAPGIVFLIVFMLLHRNFCLGQLRELSDRELTGLIIFIALLGFGIFSIHRYIIVWPLWWLVVKMRRLLNVYPPLPTEWNNLPTRRVMFLLDMQRLLRGASQDKKVLAVSDAHARWSSMQHYLYCSAYIMLILPIIFRVLLPKALQADRFWPILVSGFLLLILVLISEFRNTNLDVWATTKFPDGCVVDSSFQQNASADG